MAHIAEHYTAYHPRWLRPHVSTYWWLRKRSYFAFILREISSVFVAWSVVYLLLIVYAVGQGPAQYQQLLEWSRQPWVVIVNVSSLLLVSFHAITWFNLAPQAMVVRLRGKRVPRSWVAGAHFAGWALLSALAAWLILG